MLAGWIALVAGLLAAPVSAPTVVAAPEAVPMSLAVKPVSHCRAREKMVFTCRAGRSGRSVASVCSASGRLHYRYGPAGKPSIDIASAPDFSNVRRGGVRGGGGGWQEHLRFSRDGHDYIVHWGEAGNLTDVPGRRSSGIHVAKGERELASIRCTRPASPRGDWESLVSRVPLEDDPVFDSWF